MPIVLFNVLVASIAVCSVDNAVAPLGQQAAFAAEQTPAECQLILTSHFQSLTRLRTVAHLRPWYAQ